MTVTRLLVRTGAVLAALLVATASSAQERILDFDSDVTINADGSMLVIETLVVHVEGQRI